MSSVTMPAVDAEVGAKMRRLGTKDEERGDFRSVVRYLQTTTDGREAMFDVVAQLDGAIVDRAVDTEHGEPENETQSLTRENLRAIHHASVHAMRDDLLAECKTKTERLLVVEIVSSWCRYQLALANYGAESDIAVKSFWGKQVDRTQKHYLRSVETLARVRRYEVVLTDAKSPDGTEVRSVAITGTT